METEKFAWRAKIIKGKEKEYIFRHDHIWDEMKEVLDEAGIVNYTIWLSGNDVFGYYECTKGVAFAAKVQNASPVVKRWNEYMKEVMVMKVKDKKHAQPKLKKVFSFN